MIDKFAEELKEARIKSGMSLQQMAAKTRIDLKFLEAIDNGNFSFLPELYVKAFIKEYVSLVGLDPDETIKKYEAAKSGKLVDAEKQTDEVNPEEKEQAKTNQQGNSPLHKPSFTESTSAPVHHDTSYLNKNKLAYWAIAAAVILIMTFIYFFFIKESSEIIVAEKPYDEVVIDNKERFETDDSQQGQTEEDSFIPSDSLFLTVASAGTSWVQVILDGKSIEEFTLFPNSKKTIKAGQKYELIVGNSGVVNLSLNNKPLDYTGKPGSVRYLSVDKSGIKYLKSRPTLTGQ